MNHKLNFEPLRVWRPSSIEQLLDISHENLNYESVITDMSQFQIDEKGHLKGEGLELRFSEKGFLQLCKFLKIPNPFANFITWELLQDNINRIARGIIDKEVAIYFYENSKGENICVNVTSTRKVPLPHAIFMEPLKGLDYDIDRVTLEDNFLDVHFTNPETGHIPPMEVKQGDKIKSGMRFRNSTSGYCYPEARPMYWRLVCSNGLVMPVAEGQLRLKLKSSQDPVPKIEAFMVSMNAMLSEQTQFPDFKGLLEENLDTVEFSRWWKSLKRVLNDPDYVDDHIFEVDTDTRKHWISQAKMVAKEEEEPQPTNVNSWQLMNNITLKAQSFEPETTSKLEELAGKFLTKIEG